MRTAIFSTKPYVRGYFERANRSFEHELVFFDARLCQETVSLAAGFPCVCAFVNDELDAAVLGSLARGGTGLVALRCAGFNNVDLGAADRLGLTVARVPSYSPHAVAEHAVALMLGLNRKLVRAHARVRDSNFELDGLLGFDMHGRTAGVIGTGAIGAVVARILHGFGCNLLAYDIRPSAAVLELGARYVPLDELYAGADIITLHCPLTPETRHMIREETLARMKDGVMLINTSRGALIETRAVIAALKTGKVGYLGLDVYEEEEELFFEDQSSAILQDDVFARLLTFPNVLVTGHQAFFTHDALEEIARATLQNIRDFEAGGRVRNTVRLQRR